MRFKVKPYAHQLEALEASKIHDDYALFWEMGTGKTGGMINILRNVYTRKKRISRTLILGPLAVVQNWQREFEIHSWIPQKHIYALNKSGPRRNKEIARISELDEGILILNYQALTRKETVSLLLKWKPEVLVCDESHMLKNPQSKTSKTVYKLSLSCAHRYILTGTPILNSELDIFQQYKILDDGDTFGRTFNMFRSNYFVNDNASNPHVSWPKWIPNPYKEVQKDISRMMYRKASRVKKEECLDLPPFIKQTYEVQMSTIQAKAYEEMKKDYITWIGSVKEKTPVVAQLAVTRLLRLQQIVSGFVKTETGQEVNFDKNPRLDALEELLEGLIKHDKVIIWCSFKNDYKIIEKMLNKLQKKDLFGYVFLTGDQNGFEKQQSIDCFQQHAQCKVIVANRASGGVGINLTAARYSIVYSRDFSLANELQSEARNYRGGSEIHSNIVKIDLVTPGTVDAQVLDALSNKQKISDVILDIRP